jgi:hypothetical protein
LVRLFFEGQGFIAMRNSVPLPFPSSPGAVVEFDCRGRTITATLNSQGYWSTSESGKYSFKELNIVTMYDITEYVLISIPN